MADDIGFDPAAFSIDGARIDSELMRVLAYAATGGAEGVVTPGDCKVSPLAVPGKGIRIGTGGLIMRNRSGSAANQSYVANGRRVTTLDTVDTTPSGARSDLVVVRVEDPEYGPWEEPDPAEAPDYQYVRPRILQGVPANTKTAAELNLGYSAYALARIDRPANTGTVLAQNIVDLRKVANPRRETVRKRLTLTEAHQLTSSLAPLWRTAQVDVPSWAARVNIRADLTNIVIKNFSASGVLLATIGAQAGPKAETGLTQWNEQQTELRRNFVVFDDCYVPPEIRGTTQEFYMMGSLVGGNGVFYADVNVQQFLEAEFIEAAS